MAALDFYVSARLITVQFSKIKSTLVALAPKRPALSVAAVTGILTQLNFKVKLYFLAIVFCFQHLNFKMYSVTDVVLSVTAGRHSNMSSVKVSS